MGNLPVWITIKEATIYPKWKAKVVKYIPPEDECNNGSTNVVVRTEDKDGKYQAGIKVWQDWTDDRANEVTKSILNAIEYCGEIYGASFFQSGDSSFDPNKGQRGPYSFYVEGNSDRVEGIGLVLKRHSQDVIVFQYVEQDVTPPSHLDLEETLKQVVSTYPLMPINNTGALWKYAKAHNLEDAQTDEHEFLWQNDTYVFQVFNLGIVYAKKDDWSNIKVLPK